MNNFSRYVLLILILFLGWQIKSQQKAVVEKSGLSVSEAQLFQEYEVVPNSIDDGDTLKVRAAELNTILEIRLACVDAPELKQPMGEESRNYLRSILNRGGNKIKVQPITVNSYGRTVAQLWNGNGLIQSQMAIAGMAYKYEQYKKDCPNWRSIESAQAFAQEARLGVWALSNGGERPWDYRNSNR